MVPSSSASASTRDARRSNDYANDAYAGPESVKTAGSGASNYPTSESGAAHDYSNAGHDVVGVAPAPAAYTHDNTAASGYASQPGMGSGAAGYNANDEYTDNGVSLVYIFLTT